MCSNIPEISRERDFWVAGQSPEILDPYSGVYRFLSESEEAYFE